MKKKRISTYITLLTLLSSMLLYSPTLAAQEKKATTEEEKVPFYQGTTIGVDIFGLGSKVSEVISPVRKSVWKSI